MDSPARMGVPTVYFWHGFICTVDGREGDVRTEYFIRCFMNNMLIINIVIATEVE